MTNEYHATIHFILDDGRERRSYELKDHIKIEGLEGMLKEAVGGIQQMVFGINTIPQANPIINPQTESSSTEAIYHEPVIPTNYEQAYTQLVERLNPSNNFTSAKELSEVLKMSIGGVYQVLRNMEQGHVLGTPSEHIRKVEVRIERLEQMLNIVGFTQDSEEYRVIMEHANMYLEKKSGTQHKAPIVKKTAPVRTNNPFVEDGDEPHTLRLIREKYDSSRGLSIEEIADKLKLRTVEMGGITKLSKYVFDRMGKKRNWTAPYHADGEIQKLFRGNFDLRLLEEVFVYLGIRPDHPIAHETIRHVKASFETSK
jgi:hypothetical protein